MKNEEGLKLRVAHFPQIPCDPFYVEVDSLIEAKKTMTLLADYDYFQLENNIKPDYSNMTVLEMFEDGEWVSWMDYESGIDDLYEYAEHLEDQGFNL